MRFIVPYRLMVVHAFIAIMMAATVAPVVVNAQEPVIPNFWDQQERFIKPDTSKIRRLRFLTTTDFPPFNFIHNDRQLTGFHVDMARAICRELDLERVCQIQALPFSELEPALHAGSGDAIIAGLAISSEARVRLDFTRVYFRLPARLLTTKDTRIQRPIAEYLRGKKVGVVAGTAHEAYLRNFFSSTKALLFADESKAVKALRNGDLDGVFSDALSLSYYLQENEATKCCKFTGGAFLSEEYFGHGLAIATSPQNKSLTDALNFALRALSDKGDFAELYLRYFPVSLY